jgi:hypothetical protein
MAKETEAILEIARSEAPDITVSLHSHENRPVILQPAFVPMFMKERVHEMALNLNQRFKEAGLAYWPDDWFWNPKADDEKFPPKTTFNLVAALYHISGTTPFTFECSHGCTSENAPKPFVTYDDILDIQLTLYDEIFDTAINKRLIWKK